MRVTARLPRPAHGVHGVWDPHRSAWEVPPSEWSDEKLETVIEELDGYLDRYAEWDEDPSWRLADQQLNQLMVERAARRGTLGVFRVQRIVDAWTLAKCSEHSRVDGPHRAQGARDAARYLSYAHEQAKVRPAEAFYADPARLARIERQVRGVGVDVFNPG